MAGKSRDLQGFRYYLAVTSIKLSLEILRLQTPLDKFLNLFYAYRKQFPQKGGMKMTANLVEALQEERQNLENGLKAIDEVLRLVSEKPSPARRSITNTATPKPRASASTDRGPGRAPSTTPLFLKIVEDNPGITITEAAKRMGQKPNYLYRVAKTLVADGTLVRGEDKGYTRAKEAELAAA